MILLLAESKRMMQKTFKLKIDDKIKMMFKRARKQSTNFANPYRVGIKITIECKARMS